MYVHRYDARDRLWTVGFYDPAGAWHALEDCRSSVEAADLIHYLNGGDSSRARDPRVGSTTSLTPPDVDEPVFREPPH